MVYDLLQNSCNDGLRQRNDTEATKRTHRNFRSWSCKSAVLCLLKVIEPAHDKIYNKTFATSEDSDQTAHPRSLIRVFTDRMCLLQPQSYPKKDERDPCRTGWMYRLI